MKVNDCEMVYHRRHIPPGVLVDCGWADPHVHRMRMDMGSGTYVLTYMCTHVS